MLLGVVGGVVVVLVYKDGEKFLCKFFPYLRHNQRIGQLSKPYLQPCLNQGPRFKSQVSGILTLDYCYQRKDAGVLKLGSGLLGGFGKDGVYL